MGRSKTELSDKLKNRAIELDLLRFFAVLLMIADHLFYDLYGLVPMLFEDYPESVRQFARSYWKWAVRDHVRMVVLFVFFALVGISSSFSRSNLKRGSKLLGIAMLLTAGTYTVGLITEDLDMTIVFGVLHCLAFCILAVGLCEKLHMNKWVYLALGVLLWGLGIWINKTYDPHTLSFYSEPFFPLLGKSILGMTLCGSDCFAFPEVCGQVFVGVFLGKQFYRERRSLFGWKYRNNIFTFMGRHSLWVYFIHQMLLPVIVSIVMICLGYTFSV